MADPPVELGVKVMVAWALPATAEMLIGGFGMVIVVALALDDVAEIRPRVS